MTSANHHDDGDSPNDTGADSNLAGFGIILERYVLHFLSAVHCPLPFCGPLRWGIVNYTKPLNNVKQKPASLPVRASSWNGLTRLMHPLHHIQNPGAEQILLDMFYCQMGGRHTSPFPQARDLG
jgi:hypothetical protein